jgi:microcystin-dependent protein
MSAKSKIVTAAAAFAVASSLQSAPAQAGMDPFIGELMLVGYNFCPRGWANADGQLVAIAQYTALFSLYGTTFGGDGRTTFGLPDLRGRAALHTGQGPGLSNVVLGQKGGQETTTINQAQMPAHTHSAATTVTADVKLRGTNTAGDKAPPAGNVLARLAGSYSAGPADQDMGASAIQSTVTAATTIGNTGSGQPISIRNPFLGMRWCVALVGVFPSRN